MLVGQVQGGGVADGGLAAVGGGIAGGRWGAGGGGGGRVGIARLSEEEGEGLSLLFNLGIRIRLKYRKCFKNV